MIREAKASFVFTALSPRAKVAPRLEYSSAQSVLPEGAKE